MSLDWTASHLWMPWALALAGATAGLLVHRSAFALLDRIARSTTSRWDDLLGVHLRKPGRLLSAILGLVVARPYMVLPRSLDTGLGHALQLGFLLGGAWAVVKCIHLLRDVLLDRLDLEASDNLRSRKIHTQVKVLQNVLTSVVAVLAIALALMSFEEIRQIGISLLASAGIAGIILGLAAQKTLGNLISGIQLAITQPIRMDDVVIVEGEWGRIEEITLTYVVVKIWDLRRLVVPISHFIDKPFQNWTRSSAEIIGTVVLHCDPATDVQELRTKAAELAAATPLWDRKVLNVQLTECRPGSIEVRILLSASDSPTAWDLRCHVREGMMEYLRTRRPQWLVRTRLQMEQETSATKGNP